MRCLTAIAVAAAWLATVDAAPLVGIRAASHTLELSTVSGQLSHDNLYTRGADMAAGDVMPDGAPLPPIDYRAEPPPSLSVTFRRMIAEIRPHADKLGYLAPRDASTPRVADALISIRASLARAIPQVKTLESQQTNVALASRDGQKWRLSLLLETIYEVINNVLQSNDVGSLSSTLMSLISRLLSQLSSLVPGIQLV